MKKALIFDLDNTVYPVAAIAEQLFAELFHLLKVRLDSDLYNIVKEDILRLPFQKVAEKYSFPNELIQESLRVLRNMSCTKPIDPYPEYKLIKELQVEKFLVTAGFTVLQMSKVEQLDIKKDYREIYIIDPEQSNFTKRDIFIQIMNKYGYKNDELLIIGDDPESEIAAANSLGIESYLFDPDNRYLPEVYSTHHSQNYNKLVALFK